MRFSTSFASAVLSFAVMVSAAPANLVAKSAQDVWDPKILVPNANTVWQAGTVQTVVWDTSDKPINVSNGGRVTLSGFGTIRGPFDLSAANGHIDVNIPDVTPGTYTITLFGDSGNISPPFTITAAAN